MTCFILLPHVTTRFEATWSMRYKWTDEFSPILILTLHVIALDWKGYGTLVWIHRVKLEFMCIMAYWQSVTVSIKTGHCGKPKPRDYGRGLHLPENGIFADQGGDSPKLFRRGYSQQRPYLQSAEPMLFQQEEDNLRQLRQPYMRLMIRPL